jgi:hypothetical protein
MAEDHMRYDILTQEAMRGVVRKVLAEVSRTGLPGDHHFYISFATRAPGVRISEELIKQYDSEMTIVLQNQYWDLKVNEASFEVGLSFNGSPEMLLIPYTAIKGFFDPSVQFGLQFDPSNVADDQRDNTASSAPAPASEENASEPVEASGEKVVSLDAFRKKP